MSTTIELPDGATATLLDDTELTNKQSKSLNQSMKVAAGISLKMKELGYTDGDPESWAAIAGLDVEDLDHIDLYQRACVVMRLQSWTVTNPDGSPRPLPANEDDVDDLPLALYKPLVLAATKSENAPDFSLEAAADPKADAAELPS